MPSSACSVDHRPLHSFPTRRSSDLGGQPCPRLAAGVGPAVDPAHARHPATAARSRVAAPQRGARRAVTYRGRPVRSGCPAAPDQSPRSEEHTSELQSRVNLVCRLLLAPSTTALYTLSLHDALPILAASRAPVSRPVSVLQSILRTPGILPPPRAAASPPLSEGRGGR